MKSKYLANKLQNGGAANKGQLIGSAVGSLASLAGIPGLAPILGGLGEAIGQKFDITKALKDHFNSLNQSTNPYGNFQKGGCLPMLEHGGGIHIKPSKKGTFTAAAKKHGKGVQEFARQVLANKENYSPAMVKKANFARNAAKFKHELGGLLEELSHGGVLTGHEDASTYIGNSHNAGGVNVSSKGTPSEAPVAEVEAGEVNYNVDGKAYIFSKKMTIKYNK